MSTLIIEFDQCQHRCPPREPESSKRECDAMVDEVENPQRVGYGQNHSCIDDLVLGFEAQIAAQDEEGSVIPTVTLGQLLQEMDAIDVKYGFGDGKMIFTCCGLRL